jgi:hypothetical protein
MKASDILSSSSKLVKANGPEILTALGLSGVLTTAYLAARAGRQHESRMSEEAPDIPPREEAKLVWRYYVPPAISGALTVVCIVGGNRGVARRTTAAVAAYSITEKAFSEYKDKVVEQIGVNKEQKIRDEIAQDRVNTNPPSKEVMVMGGGHVLCCELYTGRYFRSEMEALRKIENQINHLIVHQVYVTLNELYDHLGLAYTSNSDYMGWTSDKLLELQFSTVLSPDGEPCLAFAYNYVKPIH